MFGRLILAVSIFTANCHKSALPHFAGTIMPRNWQLTVKWRPNRRIVKKIDFYIFTSNNGCSNQCWQSGSKVMRIPERAKQLAV
jgi:hypothetical protein